MKRFKKGQWVTTQWRDGDIDFAQFSEKSDEGDQFYTLQFFRIKIGGKIENLKIRRGYNEPMFYDDSRIKYPFRIATLSEVRKYKKLIRTKYTIK